MKLVEGVLTDGHYSIEALESCINKFSSDPIHLVLQDAIEQIKELNTVLEKYEENPNWVFED